MAAQIHPAALPAPLRQQGRLIMLQATPIKRKRLIPESAEAALPGVPSVLFADVNGDQEGRL